MQLTYFIKQAQPTEVPATLAQNIGRLLRNANNVILYSDKYKTRVHKLCNVVHKYAIAMA